MSGTNHPVARSVTVACGVLLFLWLMSAWAARGMAGLPGIGLVYVWGFHMVYASIFGDKVFSGLVPIPAGKLPASRVIAVI